MRIRIGANGVWGQIAISLRSEVQHPKGEPQARGIWALTPKTAPDFLAWCRDLACAERLLVIRSRLFAAFRCRFIAAAGDLLFFVSPKKPKEKKGDPAVCVPPLRYGQPAVLASSGVTHKLAFGSNKCAP